jgi:hypothetical protein
MRFELVPRHHALRGVTERMVADVFRTEYDAAVGGFPDLMIAAIDGSGRPQCAAALRDQESGFFSEQYLDEPLETAIAAATGYAAARSDILELGSLAALRPGGLLLLLRGFAEFGLDAGYHWGVFTATDRLRRLARRIGVELVDLGPADAGRIENPAVWGSYYQHDPRICAVAGPGARDKLIRSCLPCGAAAVRETPA